MPGTSFTFGGTDLKDQIPSGSNVQIIIEEINRPLRKPVTRHKIEIPGRAGSWDFGGGVARDYIISVTLAIVGDHDKVLECARNIDSFLDGKEALIFDDDPTVSHEAQVFEGVMLKDDPQHDNNLARATIVFECDA